MIFSNQPVRAVPKPKHKRGKPTQKQLGDISNKVRKEVNDRSLDFCEGCGKHKLSCWTLENAHIEGRGSISHKRRQRVIYCGSAALLRSQGHVIILYSRLGKVGSTYQIKENG